MTEKNLSEKESLALISSMISQAKSNYQKGGSFYFLLWGWVVMVANLTHYYLDAYTDYPHPYYVWAVTIPAGIFSAIYGIRQKRKALVVSHLDKLYGQVWMSIGVALIIILVFMNKLGYNHNAVIILLAAIGTFVSGSMLKFNPLKIGGMLLALSSVICFNVSITDQYLVGGIGIFAGYLIPGYLLKGKEK